MDNGSWLTVELEMQDSACLLGQRQVRVVHNGNKVTICEYRQNEHQDEIARKYETKTKNIK